MTNPFTTEDRVTPLDAQVSAAVAFDRVSLAFDDNVVLRDLSFSVPVGHMLVLLGASGVGKSVILKLILGLLKPDGGAIYIDGVRIDTMGERELMKIRSGIGMLFQESALFDSLTVAENVGYGLLSATNMTPAQARERVEDVLDLMGLGEYIERLPSELSGGQRRRVAVARAMAPRPRLLLFDEPTSGLDPITATTVDDEIIKSRDLEHATSILVTHQIRDALYMATHAARRTPAGIAIVSATAALAVPARFIMLKGARVYFEGTAEELRGSSDPYLRRFLG